MDQCGVDSARSNNCDDLSSVGVWWRWRSSGESLHWLEREIRICTDLDTRTMQLARCGTCKTVNRPGYSNSEGTTDGCRPLCAVVLVLVFRAGQSWARPGGGIMTASEINSNGVSHTFGHGQVYCILQFAAGASHGTIPSAKTS